MGTAGFGAELEQRRPIFDGSFNPEGFGREDGLVVSGLGMDEMVLVTDAASDDVEEGAGGTAASGVGSWVSLIFITLSTYFWKCSPTHFAENVWDNYRFYE